MSSYAIGPTNTEPHDSNVGLEPSAFVLTPVPPDFYG